MVTDKAREDTIFHMLANLLLYYSTKHIVVRVFVVVEHASTYACARYAVNCTHSIVPIHCHRMANSKAHGDSIYSIHTISFIIMIMITLIDYISSSDLQAAPLREGS